LVQFDVPFIPDEDYARYLNDHREQIHSVHFSLYQSEVIDARYKFRRLDIETLIGQLDKIADTRKYALVNSRMHHPGSYFDTDGLADTAALLARLRNAGVLNGIVYSDPYYLQALSDADPTLARTLEAVPSVNCGIDTFDRLTAVFDVLAATHFRLPAKIILDRSLNRRPEQLEQLVSRCRKAYPLVGIGLLANEGCLYQCPFKPAHDALIACANMNMHTDTHEINRALGCIRLLRQHPHKLFQSPFIRPEDLHRYENTVDIIKVCGRTLGAAFLKRTIDAYRRRRYPGNLLDLLDATNWMADEIFVANDQLPADFFDRITACGNDCGSCTVCINWQSQYAYALGVGIKDLRTD
jgi:collagenase-like PrtC family protease